MNATDTSPTLNEVAQALWRKGESRVAPQLLLKAGAAFPPIFIAHGLGDTVLNLYSLTSRLRVAQAVYGMQARGIDLVETPLDRVEDLAEYHLAGIRQLQSTGPYILIGYSFGGLIAWEIAQRLLKSGQEVGLLAMLDSYPAVEFLDFRLRARLFARHAATRAFSALRTNRPGEDKTIAADPIPLDETQRRAIDLVKESERRAWKSYRPRYYPGKIRFVRPEGTSAFPKDVHAVWAHLANGFELETVGGNHLGMITSHVDSVAEVVSRYVEEALNKR